MTASSGVVGEHRNSAEAVIRDARRRQRRRRIRSFFVVLVIAAVALVGYGQFRGGGGPPGGGATHSSGPPAADLPQNDGWDGGSANIPNRSCPRCVQLDTWAATVPYHDAPNDFPHNTIRTLGPDDVIVLLVRSWQPNEPAWARQRHPLRILRRQIHANFEGNTTGGRVSLWLATTWRHGSNVQVSVYFGSPIPSAGAIARAQRELDAATFPPWSITNQRQGTGGRGS